METFLYEISPFLRFFIENIDPENWREIAWSWVQQSALIGVLVANVYILLKFFLKRTAPDLDRAIWSRQKTWQTAIAGVFPSFALLSVWWALQSEFLEYVQALGLLKGGLLMSGVHLFIVFLVHVVTPWRRELL